MAEFVLGPEGWDEAKIKAAMNGNSRKSVTIEKPVNVYIVYFTAWPDAGKPGHIAWLPDVYGRDEPEQLILTKGIKDSGAEPLTVSQ
jgi:murein L,D-transpeptidase YcbB/YkuD